MYVCAQMDSIPKEILAFIIRLADNTESPLVCKRWSVILHILVRKRNHKFYRLINKISGNYYEAVGAISHDGSKYYSRKTCVELVWGSHATHMGSCAGYVKISTIVESKELKLFYLEGEIPYDPLSITNKSYAMIYDKGWYAPDKVLNIDNVCVILDRIHRNAKIHMCDDGKHCPICGHLEPSNCIQVGLYRLLKS